MWSLLWMGSVAAAAPPAGCSTVTTRAQVLQHIEVIYTEYGNLETASVVAADRALAAAIPCLGMVLTPQEVAALHRARALAAIAAEDHETAKFRFTASRKLEPTYRFPPEVVPEGPTYVEWDLFSAVPLNVMKRAPVPDTTVGILRFDGEDASEAGRVADRRLVGREVALPLFFQHLDDSGRPTVSAYVAPNAPLPAYPGSDWTAPPEERVVVKETRARLNGGDWAILGTSTALVVGGGVFVGIGTYNQLSYCRQSSVYFDDCQQQSGYWTQNVRNRWITGYSLMGAGALGFGWAGLRIYTRPDHTTVALSGSW